MKITALCQREGAWWAIEVPEVEGAFTQSRRLDQAAVMAADAVSLLLDIPPASIEVEVRPLLADATLDALREVRHHQEDAATRQAQAAAESRQLVASLRAQGLTVRDIAVILGVSPQRAQQLAADQVASLQ